jgi:hypothetical protein
MRYSIDYFNNYPKMMEINNDKKDKISTENRHEEENCGWYSIYSYRRESIGSRFAAFQAG